LREDRVGIPRAVEARYSAAGARVLYRMLGLRRATAIFGDMAVAKLRGKPFGHLKPPHDEREALSRRQIASALMLHDALKRRLPPDRAMELLQEVIVASTVIFLEFAVGSLSRSEIDAMSVEEREALFRRIGRRFFNATIEWGEPSDASLTFTVKRCLFPNLCRLAGAPEVAPLLCKGDAVYFSEVLGTIDLIRPETIAEGGTCCPFELKWKIEP